MKTLSQIDPHEFKHGKHGSVALPCQCIKLCDICGQTEDHCKRLFKPFYRT